MENQDSFWKGLLDPNANQEQNETVAEGFHIAFAKVIYDMYQGLCVAGFKPEDALDLTHTYMVTLIQRAE